MNIVLACAGGFSTSLLVEKMKKAAKEQNKECSIKAIGIEALQNNLDGTDVVLLGPQIKNAFKKAKDICDKKGVPVEVISLQDYGKVDGKAVLAHAERLLEK